MQGSTNRIRQSAARATPETAPPITTTAISENDVPVGDDGAMNIVRVTIGTTRAGERDYFRRVRSTG